MTSAAVADRWEGAIESRWATPVALTALCILSLYLRMRVLNAGFWIDEGISVGIAHHHWYVDPVAAAPGRLAAARTTCCSALWMRCSATARRATHALSLVFGLACDPTRLAPAARSSTARRARLRLLAALDPFLTYYAQETRMYALVASSRSWSRGRTSRASSAAGALLGGAARPRVALLSTRTTGASSSASGSRSRLVASRATGCVCSRSSRPASRCSTCRGCRRCSRRRAHRRAVVDGAELPRPRARARRGPRGEGAVRRDRARVRRRHSPPSCAAVSATSGTIVARADRSIGGVAILAAWRLLADLARVDDALLRRRARSGRFCSRRAASRARGAIGLVALVAVVLPLEHLRAAATTRRTRDRSPPRLAPYIQPGELVVSTHPEQVPVLRYYLGAGQPLGDDARARARHAGHGLARRLDRLTAARAEADPRPRCSRPSRAGSSSSSSRPCSATTALGAPSGRGASGAQSQAWTSSSQRDPRSAARSRVIATDEIAVQKQLLQAGTGVRLVDASDSMTAPCPGLGIRMENEQRSEHARPRRRPGGPDRRLPARQSAAATSSCSRPRNRSAGSRRRSRTTATASTSAATASSRSRVEVDDALARDPRRRVPAPAAHVADLLEQPVPRLPPARPGRDQEARPGRARALHRLLPARRGDAQQGRRLARGLGDEPLRQAALRALLQVATPRRYGASRRRRSAPSGRRSGSRGSRSSPRRRPRSSATRATR